jgi:hypothetical protein
MASIAQLERQEENEMMVARQLDWAAFDRIGLSGCYESTVSSYGTRGRELFLPAL